MFINRSVPDLNMGQKLKMFREIKGLSQMELGERLGVSDKTISAWEIGEREIGLSNAKLICELFDVPNSYFVFNENFDNVKDGMKELILNYVKKFEFKNNIETIISTCKQKIENDGLPFKKEYLPTFDYEKNNFVNCGLFKVESLPIKIVKKSTLREKKYENVVSFDNDLTNIQTYKYDSSALAKYELYDILERFNGDVIELKDLTRCNNLDVFKSTLSKMQAKKYTSKNHMNPYSEGKDVSKEYLQDQLNSVLENLDPNLSKFWEIIVFLIDNGAFYIRQHGYGSDVVCWDEEKDVSKTNLTYRHAKDMLKK